MNECTTADDICDASIAPAFVEESRYRELGDRLNWIGQWQRFDRLRTRAASPEAGQETMAFYGGRLTAETATATIDTGAYGTLYVHVLKSPVPPEWHVGRLSHGVHGDAVQASRAITRDFMDSELGGHDHRVKMMTRESRYMPDLDQLVGADPLKCLIGRFGPIAKSLSSGEAPSRKSTRLLNALYAHYGASHPDLQGVLTTMCSVAWGNARMSSLPQSIRHNVEMCLYPELKDDWDSGIRSATPTQPKRRIRTFA